MILRLKPWQTALLIAPIAIIVTFLLVAAGQQIRAWGINWIWAIFIFMLLGWRLLLVKWTRPAIAQAEAIVSEVNAELDAVTEQMADDVARMDAAGRDKAQQIESALSQILTNAQDDPPIWDDWGLFWQHCLATVTAVSSTYYPDVKRPLLNIYVPEAYGLIRGTVDDTDRMMQKLSPVLSQVSIGQMVEGVELYRKLEPSARKLIKAVNWAQWALNPAAAVARQVSSKNIDQANQQIVLNLSSMLRETALRNLAQQAIALYGGEAKVVLDEITAAPAIPAAKTQTLKEILDKAEPAEAVAQKPVNILLVGRTGAGKSSVINTLFRDERAAVDVLPSTDKIQSYRWQGPTAGLKDKADALTLWDTPGYEQVAREDLREQVLNYASEADVVLLVTPALDPALQMDADFLQAMREDMQQALASREKAEGSTEIKRPTIAVVTQVDKLRPVREWSPPYHWRTGAWPKETSIREAVNYRAEQLGEFCEAVLPLVTRQVPKGPWGDEALAEALIGAITPAKQSRLARFLRSQNVRAIAAAKIIDRYTFQMTTTEGVAKLLKSPILQFISTLTTGTPALGALLIERLPVEEVPIVLGKLQMAYELYTLLGDESSSAFDLLALWPYLLNSDERYSADRRAWAFGHALTEYWSQNLPIDQLEQRINFYLTTEGV